MELFYTGEEDIDVIDVGDISIDGHQFKVNFLSLFQLKVSLFFQLHHRQICTDYINSRDQICVSITFQFQPITAVFLLWFLEHSTEIYVLLLIVNW